MNAICPIHGRVTGDPGDPCSVEVKRGCWAPHWDGRSLISELDAAQERPNVQRITR